MANAQYLPIIFPRMEINLFCLALSSFGGLDSASILRRRLDSSEIAMLGSHQQMVPYEHKAAVC
jgi:hypothetical protein